MKYFEIIVEHSINRIDIFKRTDEKLTEELLKNLEVLFPKAKITYIEPK